MVSKSDLRCAIVLVLHSGEERKSSLLIALIRMALTVPLLKYIMAREPEEPPNDSGEAPLLVSPFATAAAHPREDAHAYFLREPVNLPGSAVLI